ncbi:MAG: hypothetical protein ABJE66_25745 [Deltaproteobacteria bacterium]
MGLCAFGCTSSSSGDENLVKGFNPPPVADGYTRYVLPAVTGLRPGENKIFCQWIALPTDTDVDFDDVEAYQSVTGHHVALYSTSETEDVGTSRECTVADMIPIEFLGGVGGEGAPNVAKLPEGFVFRARKKRMLVANSHYLNATDSVQDVQSVIDVKTSAPSPALTAVGMAVINWSDFQIPANTPSYTSDAYCTWQQDIDVLMWSNHMHENGRSVMTELMRGDGTIDPLRSDPQWTAEQAFNPSWATFPATAPMHIHAGDTTHIQCTWQNNTGSMMQFPDEMCDGVGMYIQSPAQIICDAAPHTGT